MSGSLVSATMVDQSGVCACVPGPTLTHRAAPTKSAVEYTASLPVGDPDVLDLRSTPQELAPFAGARVEPVATRGRRPGPLHVRRGRELDRLHPGGVAEVPHALHVVVLGQHCGERVLGAGD